MSLVGTAQMLELARLRDRTGMQLVMIADSISTSSLQIRTEAVLPGMPALDGGEEVADQFIRAMKIVLRGGGAPETCRWS